MMPLVQAVVFGTSVIAGVATMRLAILCLEQGMLALAQAIPLAVVGILSGFVMGEGVIAVARRHTQRRQVDTAVSRLVMLKSVAQIAPLPWLCPEHPEAHVQHVLTREYVRAPRVKVFDNTFDHRYFCSVCGRELAAAAEAPKS
jgi:hypothetical protein